MHTCAGGFPFDSNFPWIDLSSQRNKENMTHRAWAFSRMCAFWWRDSITIWFRWQRKIWTWRWVLGQGFLLPADSNLQNIPKHLKTIASAYMCCTLFFRVWNSVACARRTISWASAGSPVWRCHAPTWARRRSGDEGKPLRRRLRRLDRWWVTTFDSFYLKKLPDIVF